jgi:Na+/serine symporter
MSQEISQLSDALKTKLPNGEQPAITDSTVANQGTDARRLLTAYKQMLVALFVTTLIVIIVLVALLLPFSFLFNSDNKDPPLIFVVILAGSLGAFFSALIRLYNFEELPKVLIVDELQGLPKGYLRVYSLVPAVVGAIAATVLYLIFAAELLQGDLFPEFSCDLTGSQCKFFQTLLNNWHPAQATDYAKMLVWAFVAGFAERLVPDTLRNLSRAGQQTEKPWDTQQPIAKK